MDRNNSDMERRIRDSARRQARIRSAVVMATFIAIMPVTGFTMWLATRVAVDTWIQVSMMSIVAVVIPIPMMITASRYWRPAVVMYGTLLAVAGVYATLMLPSLNPVPAVVGLGLLATALVAALRK